MTAVELMPVHAFTSEGFLHERGLTNYWGYNTLSWFAPTSRYAVKDPVVELKQAVKALHKAGIEVILDVVYNHTAEGNQLGPTLNFRGIDNRAYYFHRANDRRFYDDVTGCRQHRRLRSSRSCRPTSCRRCAISPKNSASTAFASISPPCSGATARASIPTRRSSRCWPPIRCWPT